MEATEEATVMEATEEATVMEAGFSAEALAEMGLSAAEIEEQREAFARLMAQQEAERKTQEFLQRHQDESAAHPARASRAARHQLSGLPTKRLASGEAVSREVVNGDASGAGAGPDAVAGAIGGGTGGAGAVGAAGSTELIDLEPETELSDTSSFSSEGEDGERPLSDRQVMARSGRGSRASGRGGSGAGRGEGGGKQRGKQPVHSSGKRSAGGSGKQPVANAKQPVANAKQPVANAKQPVSNAKQPVANGPVSGGIQLASGGSSSRSSPAPVGGVGATVGQRTSSSAAASNRAVGGGWGSGALVVFQPDTYEAGQTVKSTWWADTPDQEPVVHKDFWFPAVVLATDEDGGTVDLKYDDGVKVCQVPVAHVRRRYDPTRPEAEVPLVDLIRQKNLQRNAALFMQLGLDEGLIPPRPSPRRKAGTSSGQLSAGAPSSTTRPLRSGRGASVDLLAAFRLGFDFGYTYSLLGCASLASLPTPRPPSSHTTRRLRSLTTSPPCVSGRTGTNFTSSWICCVRSTASPPPMRLSKHTALTTAATGAAAQRVRPASVTSRRWARVAH